LKKLKENEEELSIFFKILKINFFHKKYFILINHRIKMNFFLKRFDFFTMNLKEYNINFFIKGIDIKK
jgi:hypothetical protein